MMKRSPRNVRRITRRDLDALRLIAAPGLQKSAKLRDAQKLALLDLVHVTIQVSPRSARATSWTARLTDKGQAFLDALR